MDSRFAKAFVVGSSLPATLWTLVVTGLSHKARPCPKDVDYEMLAVVVPAAFGLFNAVMVHFPGDDPQTRMASAGALFGLISAAYGTFATDLHRSILGVPHRLRFAAFLWEPLFYAFVWGVVVHQLNEIFGLYATE